MKASCGGGVAPLNLLLRPLQFLLGNGRTSWLV